MLQQPEPEDFVLATGETHRVREFVEKAFAVVGITVKYVLKLQLLRGNLTADRWEGEGEQEVGLDAKTGKTIVKVDPRYFRPAEVEYVNMLSRISALADMFTRYKTSPRRSYKSRGKIGMEADR